MMLCKRKYCFWLILVTFCGKNLSAQLQIDTVDKSERSQIVSDSLFIIGDIHISGNKKTRASIILREISIQPNDVYSLKALVKKFENARRQLMNTTLFNAVTVAVKDFNGNKVNIMVDVKERWYLFPIPYFKPVDRNLNQWLIDQKASLSRVNYGAKLLYNNATGRNDKLRLWLIGGYTKQVSLIYDRLYVDNKMKWGIRFGFAAGKSREMNYNTIDDKQVFLKDYNNYVRNFSNSFFELTYRRAIKTRHSFGIAYTTEKVSDTIVSLNPSYFKYGKNNITFPELYYNMTYFDVDYIPYPTRGYAADVYIGKKGFNNSFNVWHLSAKALGSWHIMPRTFFNINLYGGIKLPLNQPYYNKRFLGYNDVFLQGYEYNVIDGVAGGYIKATLTRELLKFVIRVPPVKKGRDPVYIPFRIYGKIFGNNGYVYNQQPGENRLSNTLLYSGGFGIDIISFYDVTFKLEWTFNQLGQNGIFLHRKTNF